MSPFQTFFLFAFILFAFSVRAQDTSPEAIGTWLLDNGSARIRLAPCGVALCGTLIWMREPRKDIYNPDEKERSNDLVGKRIFSGMVQEDGAKAWKGTAYNPEDGRTYQGAMKLDNGLLTFQGCVTNGVICHSMSWAKVN